MENLLYILTFSFQVFGFILLAEKIIVLSKNSVIGKYIAGTGKPLIMKNGKVTIKKTEYLDVAETMINIFIGTFFSMIGLVMTLFDFQTNLLMLNKICYSISIINILFIVLFIIKKVILKKIMQKYIASEDISLKNCDVPDGAMAIEIQEDK